METLELTGNNFSLNGTRVIFFGHAGMHMRPGKWAIRRPDEPVYSEVEARSLVHKVREGIKQAAKRNRYKIASILMVSPRFALTLYMEGVLTHRHMSVATESDGLIEIPDVDFDGRVFMIRVLPHVHNEIAVADANGRVY